MMAGALYKIEFYVPPSHLEPVKQALFAAGAGRLGAYENCAWQTMGRGQYRPIEGSSPFVGAKGNLETIEEYKVELVCEERFLPQVMAALRRAHPYEEPAHSILRLTSLP